MKLKKRILLISAILMLVASGASAKKQNSPSQKKKNVLEAEYTINLHDNCPRTTAALNEEVALRATIPGYRGTFSVIYKTWPEEKYAYPLTGYYACCLRIKDAIEKSKGKKCTLLFNSSQDMCGLPLDFSTTAAATESVVKLIESKQTEAYAFYIFED